MDLRTIQKPLKDSYREDPTASKITLTATGESGDSPVVCSVGAGQALREAQAHGGVGGPGTGACSGDLLLEALAACAQITCQMVATAMQIETKRIAVGVDGDLDLRGTLGISRDVPVGFEKIRLQFEVDAPEASDQDLADLQRKTERYCTVMQTILQPPTIETSLARSPG